MVNSISNSHASQQVETARPAPAQTQQSPKQSAPQPSDKVTLKSTGDVDHDGDSH